MLKNFSPSSFSLLKKVRRIGKVETTPKTEFPRFNVRPSGDGATSQL